MKLVFAARYGELPGAHPIGAMATEEEILHAMHPHPTFSESIMEAAGQVSGESVHI